MWDLRSATRSIHGESDKSWRNQTRSKPVSNSHQNTKAVILPAKENQKTSCQGQSGGMEGTEWSFIQIAAPEAVVWRKILSVRE